MQLYWSTWVSLCCGHKITQTAVAYNGDCFVLYSCLGWPFLAIALGSRSKEEPPSGMLPFLQQRNKRRWQDVQQHFCFETARVISSCISLAKVKVTRTHLTSMGQKAPSSLRRGSAREEFKYSNNNTINRSQWSRAKYLTSPSLVFIYKSGKITAAICIIKDLT